MEIELRYFDITEFDCKHTGENQMKDLFLTRLDELRHRCGFPFIVNSGYRDETHPIEAKKEKPGTHSKGIAVDIRVNGGVERAEIVRLGLQHGFNAIGVYKEFVHLGYRKGQKLVMWVKS